MIQKSYNYYNRSYAIEQIQTYDNSNRIDFNLDCQRGLVWDDKRQQDLIDTLMMGERIPEFHVIKEDTDPIFRVADGKQRLTNILLFINNKLSWKKREADPAFYPLFGNKNSLYFKELPKEYQTAILNTEISFACYRDMDERAITKLFRKLNAGVPLSSFARGLAGNITIKTGFLNELMAHPVIEKVFSVSMIEKDDAELTLLRILLLLDTVTPNESIGALDLRPTAIFSYIPDVVMASNEEIGAWTKKMERGRAIIKKYLDILDTYDDSLRTSKSSTLLFTVLYAYTYDLNDTQLFKLYNMINATSASAVVGAGADFSAPKIQTWIRYINKNFLPEVMR